MVALLIAWPVGNFPIDDDFSHSGPVRRAPVDGGRFEMPWFSAMTLVTHVLWATPFALVAGFLYDVLRVSTLVLALAGIIGFWKFARLAITGHRAALRRCSLRRLCSIPSGSLTNCS